jgi:hypothetical protein
MKKSQFPDKLEELASIFTADTLLRTHCCGHIAADTLLPEEPPLFSVSSQNRSNLQEFAHRPDHTRGKEQRASDH